MKALILYLHCAIYLFLSFNLFAIDGYHTAIQNQLQTEYNITGGSWVFADNEATKTSQYTSYGLALTDINVTGEPFTQGKNVNVTNPGSAPYSNAVAILNNTSTINAGDRAVLVFWGRGISGANGGNGLARVNLERAGPPYEKQVTALAQFSTTWTQYIFPFEFTTGYVPGEMQFSFQVGHQVQEVQFAGMALINYGTSYSLGQLPEKNFNDYYPGIEPTAQWRTDANNRIEQIRKADLTVRVKDTQGNLISGATVEVDMDCHEFVFGSAVNGSFIAGNSQQNNTYQDKMLNIDGNGHGFNSVVFENDLKWRAWEGNWPGTVAEKENAINWLRQRGIRLRGHALAWGGWSVMPDRMQANQNDPAYLVQEIDNHLTNILTNPTINGAIEEWDVFNEMTNVRDLEYALAGYQQYVTGREIYPELFNRTAQLDPTTKRYINDYATITNGGLNTLEVNRYKQFLNELGNAVNYEGIGFQAHVSFPVDPLTVYNILEDFHVTYGKEMKITEYDMKGINPAIQYEYMRDFLMSTFSHEGVNGFMFWGFWDGAHWLGDAPMYDINWNLKPGGQAFIDKVFNDWWTNEQANTASNGEATIRGFKGKHTITIKHNGLTQTVPVVIDNDKVVDIVFTGSSCLPIGTACNDNDANTASDIEDGSCNCAGTPIVNNPCSFLLNGDFSNGVTDWALFGANLQEINEEAHLEIVTPGPDPWSITFKQTGLLVEQGKTYRVTYDARASVNRGIWFKVGESVTPFTGYFYQNESLTEDMNTFTYTFTMNEATDPNTTLEFHVGQEQGDVVIDNVEIVEVTCVPEVCDIVGPQPFTFGTGNFNCFGCTVSSLNSEAHVEIPAQTPNPWEVTMGYPNINLEQGKQYEISFDARAEMDRAVTLKIGESVTPYLAYSYSVFELTTTMQSFSAIITMREPDDPAANFQFFLGNSAADVYFDNINVQEIGCGNTTALDITLFMEGCYDATINEMASALNPLGLLPGQSNNTNLTLPYAGVPWNYAGTESSRFDENIYTNMAQDNGHGRAIDWVLMEFREGPLPSTSVGRKAALVMNNGKLVFPEPVDFLVDGQSYYVKADHWSHNGVMSPTPVAVVDKTLVFDFTAQDGYLATGGFAAKEVSVGVWAMYGGNCDQQSEMPGYDINGSDRQFWSLSNGLFNIYNSADMNLDGDVNGFDRILWSINNGIFSDLRR